MGDFLQFLGSYWWLACIFGPVIGGWFTAAAKYNERKRRDNIEMMRVKLEGQQARLHDVADGVGAHVPQQAGPETPPTITDADIQRLVEADANMEQRWLSYELDVAKLIDFPLMTDMREQVTRDFHAARRKVDVVRPADVTVLRDRDRFLDYQNAVVDFTTTFDIALAEAQRRRQQDFSSEERARLDTAQQMLAIALNDAATAAERQTAYRQAIVQLEGLVVLPQSTTDNIEHRIAGAIEA